MYCCRMNFMRLKFGEVHNCGQSFVLILKGNNNNNNIIIIGIYIAPFPFIKCSKALHIVIV